jgi:hypothetical protein
VNPPTRLPAAAPRRVWDRLEQAGDGPVRVVHRGPRSLYLDLDGWCVGIVDATAARVPCALRTTSLLGVAGDRAEITDGVLRVDGVPVVVGRLLDVTVPALTTARTALRPSSETEPAGSWWERLVGAGEGLTPYGDDVLCGWLAVHRAAGVATPRVDEGVRSLLHRTTLLSATLLDCAMLGEVLPEFATWVRRLGTPGEPAAAAALGNIGHTSGRGLLAGARRALGDVGLAGLATGAAA